MARTEEEGIERLPIVGVIPLHFDVPDHVLPLDTFIETAARTHDIIDSFNRALFSGNLDYEIYVLAPENGSFKNNLAIYVFGGVAAIATFAETDMGKSFVEGLTGYPPAHYFKEAGRYIQRKAVDFVELNTSAPDDVNHEDEVRGGGTAILVETTKSFLQKDLVGLRKIGIDERRFRDAYDARNKFYGACAQNKNVGGIGFEDEPNFPIRRSDFARLYVALGTRDEVPPADWIVEVVILSVTSPNWDRDDRNRTWKGKDANKKERNFLIDDENFWRLVRAREINPSIVDVMKVQWAFAFDRRRTPRVLKVLEYNEQVLGVALDDNALQTLLGNYRSSIDDQNSLFGRA